MGRERERRKGDFVLHKTFTHMYTVFHGHLRQSIGPIIGLVQLLSLSIAEYVYIEFLPNLFTIVTIWHRAYIGLNLIRRCPYPRRRSCRSNRRTQSFAVVREWIVRDFNLAARAIVLGISSRGEKGKRRESGRE